MVPILIFFDLEKQKNNIKMDRRVSKNKKLVFIIGANREEALHKLFKGGLHYTDNKTHLWTLTKVNCVRSFLRYLVHGGVDSQGNKAGQGLA